MLSNLKLSIPLTIALSISCMPQFSCAKFITLENEEQYTTLIQSKQPFVLQFAATWCHACNTVKQAVEEVAQEPEFDAITVARVDVDKLQSLVSQYQIKSIPTFLYFNNGSKIDIPAPMIRKTEYHGFNSNKPKESLRDNMRKYLMSDAPTSTQTQTQPSTTSPAPDATPSNSPAHPLTTETASPNSPQAESLDSAQVKGDKQTHTKNDSATSHSFKDTIRHFIDSIMTFIHKIIQGIKNLFS